MARKGRKEKLSAFLKKKAGFPRIGCPKKEELCAKSLSQREAIEFDPRREKKN